MEPLVRLEHGVVDLLRDEVRLHDGHVRRLTTKEADALRYLFARRGEVVRRDALHTEVWGYSPEVASRAVDNTIRRLRQKIEPSESSHNALVFDDEGTLHLLQAAGFGAMNHHRYDGGWTLVGEVDPDWSQFRRARADAAGDLHVVYLAPTFTTGVVRYAHYDGTDWTIEDVTAEPGMYRVPSFDVEPDGTVHAAWVDTVDQELRYTTNATGSFAEPQVLAEAEKSDGLFDSYPLESSLAVAPDGTVHLAWARATGIFAGDLEYAASTDGFVAEVIATEEYGSSMDLEVGDDGVVHIAAYQFDGAVRYLTR